MSKQTSVEIKLTGEIMSCDTFIKAISEKHSKKEIMKAIETELDVIRNFEKRFSRFLSNNELSAFNNGQSAETVSEDFHNMLTLSKKFYDETNGIFDISILPSLLEEGYTKSKKQGFTKDNVSPATNTSNTQNSIRKIDLGGIGKGYIVDKVSKNLSQDFHDFVVDCGGDMYCSGVNSEENYDYWAIGVENPQDPTNELATLTVKNKGVATSGVNKRKWIKQGQEKNHLIDPRTGKSVQNDLLTVTVIANTAVEADVYAKSFLIMGQKEGLNFANKNVIASLFIDKDLNLFKSAEMEKYVWKN